MNPIIKRNLRLYLALIVAICLVSVFSMSTSWASVFKHATLADITLYGTGGVKLTPTFSAEQTKYRVSVNSDITNLLIRATMAEADAMKINGQDVKTGDDYNAKLAVGKNKFELTVTAQSGATNTYTIYVKRENIKPVIDKFLKLNYTDPATGQTMPYRLFVPENYDASKAYPLVLFLHGSGERGDDNEAQLTANQGATIWAKPDEQAKHPCFVLAPQAHSGVGFDLTEGEDSGVVELSDDLTLALKIMDQVTENYNIDKKRLYATGVSQGGFGVWNVNEQYPKLFAAIVPICGGGNLQFASRLVNKPIWAFHAESDPIVSVSYSRNMINAIRNAGGKPMYSEFPREMFIKPMGHYSWVLAYQTSEMRDWLFKQKQ
jgi:predicted peptidase